MRIEPPVPPPTPSAPSPWDALELTALDVALLQRYWQRTASPNEVAAVEAWFGEKPQRREWYEQLRAGVEGGNYSALPPNEITRRTAKILEAVDRTSQRTTRFPPDARRASWLAPQRILLSLVTMVAIAIGIVQYHSHYPDAQMERVQRYQTAPGQRATMQLADGSIMTLAPATTVQVSSQQATVRGAAYFQLTPRKDRPFAVRTQNAVVQVLGTRFMVRQYRSEQQSRIAVADGKVALRTLEHVGVSQRYTILSAHMLGVVTDSTIAVMAGGPADNAMAWTHDQLVFELVPLRDVLADVARAYGAEIRLADSALARQQVSTTISVQTQPLPAALSALAQAVHAHVIRAGQTYVVVSGRASPPAAPTGQQPPFASSHQETQYGK